MKILFDHPEPFFLVYGGFEIQIGQTQRALEGLGVVVEPLRWWDRSQQGDLIHFFGRPFPVYVQMAHQNGIPVVFTALHSSVGVRATWKRRLQKTVMRIAERAVPSMISRLAWDSYRTADACLVVTPWEARLVRELFGAPADKVHVVPNGIEDEFFSAARAERGRWLITTASILPVKRVLETAQAAVAANTPYWVMGRPQSESDAYYARFVELCRAHPEVLRYEGGISDRARLAALYREARGFVLLSRWESLSISSLEAAACECPLLLSDLPWAQTVFGDKATYCPTTASVAKMAESLREFYDRAPRLAPPPPPKRWSEIGVQLKGVYESVLNRPR